ncbi:MAG: YlmH/Sll1252 family protein [bacterium]|nr:YlmH/Sll1252 family protein [bacterium]
MKIVRETLLLDLSKDDKMKIANLLDKYERYQKTKQASYSNFLDPRIYKIWKGKTTKLNLEYTTVEVIPACEKRVISFGKYDHPVSSYFGTTQNPVTHRDILGSLFSIGMNPDTIGDIFVEKDGFYLTNLTKFNSYLEENFRKIGKEKVTLKKVSTIILRENHFQEFTILISSLRLDSLISKLSHISRKQAKQLLNDQFVLVNYQEVKDTYFVKEEDVISIRRVGKFQIGRVVGKTKKENLILEIKKYQ